MTDIKKLSVTRNDVGDKWSSIVHWVLNYLPMQRTGLPAYWSQARDYYLRQILYQEFHDFWAGAIGIAITKMASLAWELESNQPRVKNYFHELLLAADDNQGWVKFLSRHLQDYLGCDNGAFVEVVRASNARGARVVGLMHLDSLRCTRTGDPETPVLYRDRKGEIHELKAHQVMMYVDMPNATETYHGIGLCATSRAWGAIKKMEAIERFYYEKISGERVLALDLLGGVLQKDVETAVESAKEDNEGRGNSTYMGAVLVPVPSDVPLSHVRINFAELPDGFDYEKQVNNCILTFANAIGLDPQDLQPLTGRPLGTGEQSQVLSDKAEGRGLVSWRQDFMHNKNQFVLPDTVVFAFSENDIRQRQREADLFKTNSEAVGTLVEKQILTGDQAKQILADNQVIPQEFVPEDTTPTESISDSEKPEIEEAATEEEPQSAEPQEIKEAQSSDTDSPFRREGYRERYAALSRRPA